MENFKVFIKNINDNDTLFTIVMYLFLSGIIKIGSTAYKRIALGKKKENILALSQDKINGKYKIRKIFQSMWNLIYVGLGLLLKNNVMIYFPIIFGVSLTLIKIIKEDQYENVLEYEKGIIYRGKIVKWQDITIISETDDYKEIRIKESELYLYKRTKIEHKC